MKQGWERKSLGEIADVEYGFTDKSTEEGDYRYVRITDIDNNGELISTEKKYLKYSKEAEGFLINNNDLLMARTGATFAKVLLYEDFEPSVFASYLIRIKFKEKIENKLYWYFTKTKSYWEQANSLASGAAQPHFNGAALKQVIFSYPKSFSEQQRIVAILDEAFAAIAKAKANAEQNLKNAKELFESYLKGVFENPQGNWEACSLETYIKLIDYRGRTPVKTESGVRLITAKNVKLGYLQLEPQEFIAAKNYENWMSRGIPRLGDVIFTTEAPLANVAQIESNEKLAFAQRIIVMQPKLSKLNQTFLKYMLLSNPIRNKILIKGTGATVLGIKSSLLKKIEISFPRLMKEQEFIVKKLDALYIETKKLESIYQQKINDLEELKKSVLQKAFAGELAVADKVAKIIPMPVKVEGISSTDLQAGIVALAMQRHDEMNNSNTLHHVKTEKIVHLAEYIVGIDLERNPIKDAAGPNDFPHGKKVESRAAKAGFYTVKKQGDFYTYTPGSQFNKIIAKVKSILKEKEQALIQLIDLIVPMKTQQAEIFATVYAAWNNLLIDNVTITDEAIVYEARENWHIDKLNIPREKFFGAIDWMKKNSIIPKGSGKKVLPKNKK